MKGKTKGILLFAVVKWRHRANGLLAELLRVGAWLWDPATLCLYQSQFKCFLLTRSKTTETKFLPSYQLWSYHVSIHHIPDRMLEKPYLLFEAKTGSFVLFFLPSCFVSAETGVKNGGSFLVTEKIEKAPNSIHITIQHPTNNSFRNLNKHPEWLSRTKFKSPFKKIIQTRYFSRFQSTEFHLAHEK